MKTYYLLMKHGVPVDVCTMLNDALLRQKEWTTPGAPAEILAVAPVQLELDFDDEPTKPERKTCFGGCCLGPQCMNVPA